MSEVGTDPDGGAHLEVGSGHEGEDEGDKSNAEAATDGCGVKKGTGAEKTAILEGVTEERGEALAVLGVQITEVSRHDCNVQTDRPDCGWTSADFDC